MKYLSVLLWWWLFAWAGPVLHLCETTTNAERSAFHHHRRKDHQPDQLPQHGPEGPHASLLRYSHQLFDNQHHRPIPQLWSSRTRREITAETAASGTTSASSRSRVRRAYDEPMGSQASPFAPPDTGTSERQREPAKTARAGGGPFTPPEGPAEFRAGGGGGGGSRGDRRNRKKTRRGGWEPGHQHHHDHHGHHDDDEHVIEEEEEVIEEDDDPHHHHVDEYKAPLLNPAHDGHIKIKSHRPPSDPHWSDKDEAHHHPWDDDGKHHHEEEWKQEAQYKINDVKLRIPPVKFRFHLTPNVKIISGSKDPLERPPPPEPEEHFPWEKPKDIPDLPWWPDAVWPEKKNCTAEDQKDSQECKDMQEKSGNLTQKNGNKKKTNRNSRGKVDKRKGSSSNRSSASKKKASSSSRSRGGSKSKSSSSASSSNNSKKKRRVTRRTEETAASTRVQHRIRVKPRRNGIRRSRSGWESEAYHHLPASPWNPPRPTWGDDVYVQDDDDDEEVEIDDSKNEHRGSDAEGDAKNGTGWDPQINWQDSPIHFAAHKRRWPPDTPRYSPMFKVKINPRIWTEAPPSTTTTTTEPTTTTEEDETANIDDEESSTESDEETTTEEPTTVATTEEVSTEAATTTESTTTEDATTASTSTQSSTRFREPTTNEKGQFGTTTPMSEETTTTTTTEMPTTTTTTEMTTTTTTTTEMPTTAGAESTTITTTASEEATTTLEPTTEEPSTTEEAMTTMPSTTPTTTEEVTTEPSGDTGADGGRGAGGSRGRRPGSRIPKVFGEMPDSGNPEDNSINVSAGRGSTSTTPAPTTVSGTTTSWLFGLMNTTTEFSSSAGGPSLEREEPPLRDSVSGDGRPGGTDLRPRRRLGALNPVKIDVSSPEELAGVAVNAKVLHLFLGGPNSTSLHDSVVTVAKAVNQYNNYYRRR